MKKSLATNIMVLSLAVIGLAGCGKEGATSGGAEGVLEGVVAVWEKGDQPGAVKRFLQADWKRRPLFPSGSPLNLRESQFVALAAGERERKQAEILAGTRVLKELAAAVVMVGQNSAAKGDVETARRCFSSLDRAGEALDQPDSLALLRLVGQAFKKQAAAESVHPVR